MARFVFEARTNTRESAIRLQQIVQHSEIQYLEHCQQWRVSGIVPDYDLEGLGLAACNLHALQEFTVNRVLAEVTSAQARSWRKGG